jgi:hypothetical protein
LSFAQGHSINFQKINFFGVGISSFERLDLKGKIWSISQWENDKGRRRGRGRERWALEDWLRGLESDGWAMKMILKFGKTLAFS